VTDRRLAGEFPNEPWWKPLSARFDHSLTIGVDVDDGNQRRIEFEAIDPTDGKNTCWVMNQSTLQFAARRGHRIRVLEAAELVPFVLLHPTSIFQGLRNEADDDTATPGWLCYCGVPLTRFERDGSRKNALPRKVFLVFVNTEGIIYEWRWENADVDDPRLPFDHENRFRKQVL